MARARTRIDRALSGHGGALWITGPAGIGKSVLLDDLLATVDDVWSVVRIDGAAHESKMVWSGVSQLVHRLRTEVGELKVAHRRIIETIVDPTSGDAPDEFSAAVSVHALVAQAAEHSPTIIAIDDHHWLDPDSARVLDFVGRRLDGVRALVIATSRLTAPSGDQIALDQLTPAEAAELLVGRGVSLVTAQQLGSLVGGHPLTLDHAVRSLTAAQRMGADPLPTPFPISADDLPSHIASAVSALSDPARRAMHFLAAAEVLGRTWRATMDRAGVPLDVLTEAEDAGVITITAADVRFTHPLFAAAAYADATPAQRRVSHRLLADIADDPERSLWHESRAVIGPDDRLAGRLAEVAERARAAGACASAFEAWHRAGELSSRAGTTAAFEILAAEAALQAGNTAPAREIIERSPPLESRDPALVRLGASYEARSGHAEAASVLYLRCAALLEADQPDRAASALLDAVRLPLRTGQLHGALAALDRLDQLHDRVESVQTHLQVRVLRTLLNCTTGESVETFVEATDALVPKAGPLVGDLGFLADSVALGLAFQRQYGAALALVERLRIAAAERNEPSLIPMLDTAKACALSSVDLPGCMIAAANAVEWADAIGQPNLGATALGYLGTVQAALGDAGVFATSDRVRANGTEHGNVSAGLVRGFYWITMGQPERAVDELLPLDEWAAGELKIVLFWQADLGEAAARSGHTELARAQADQLHRFNAVFPNPWLAGAAARVEGLLADVDECGVWLAASTEAFAGAGITIAEARSELIWGERLRRARRRSEARQHLLRARDLFTQLGAGRWIERCEQELIAAGGATQPIDHSHDAERVLTPQELQIARLSVAGHSNRDIGAITFISPRTVETHLSAIYRKLGARNRAALAALAAADPALRTTAP